MMEKKIFNGYREYATYLIDGNKGAYITTAVMKYDEAVKLVKALMLMPEIIPHAVDLEPVEYDNYDDEYYISVDENNLIVEKAKIADKDKYLNACADTTLINYDCSSRIISANPESEFVEVEVIEDDVLVAKKPKCVIYPDGTAYIF